MSVPEKDGLYGWVPEDVYHGDRDSLSSSGGRSLLSTCPQQFRYNQLAPPKPKRVFDYGSTCHKLVLGVGADIAVVDAEDWRTKAAKDKRDAAWERGRAVVLAREYAQAEAMAAVVREHRVAAALLGQGQAEMSGWWTDPETGVRLRFRPDFINAQLVGGRMVVVDYKTTADAHPAAFARSMGDYGYHAQGGWYLDGLAATTGVTDAVFVLVAQSKTAPYCVSVHQVEQEDLERGKLRNRKAIRLYAECVESGHWPGYEGINMLRLSDWARREVDNDTTMEGEM